MNSARFRWRQPNPLRWWSRLRKRGRTGCSPWRGNPEVELLTSVAVGYRRVTVRHHAKGGVEMQDLAASVQDRVLSVVRSILAQNAITADVHPESRLVDIGLDSMDM